ncbi:hypothetical protein [Embleya sp. NPDC020630]|uniref:hypothetical protein n=1 Tax=Embleya sp. NPDC020630 TaxID=3363979 RepID=UPI0037AD89CE
MIDTDPGGVDARLDQLGASFGPVVDTAHGLTLAPRSSVTTSDGWRGFVLPYAARACP